MSKLEKFLQMAVVLIATVLIPGISGALEKLYVFYPSVISPASVQEELMAACPRIEITVFGRFRDFEEGIATHAPDAILTKPDVIDHIGGYAIRLNGIRKGKTTESYLFLSVNKQINVSRMSDKTIGVFDMLGRKGMNRFIGKFLNPVPDLQRVSKMEDLLQLLTYDMAEGILIPQVYVDYYKKVSKLNFAMTPFPKMKVGILALGVKKGKKAALTITTLKNMKEKYMTLLEVEQWK